MKTLLSYIKRAPKRFVAFTALLLALVALPLNAAMAADVVMEGSIGVANQTTGETMYKESTNASYDQVVKFSVYYHNRELPDSGRVAKDFKIKIDMPTAAGTNQVVKVTMGGSNTNSVTDTATVVLNRSDAHLEFIPGSVYWKHNTGTRTDQKIVTQQIADSIILNGTTLENVQPCHEFEATVTFMARVKVPAVSVNKYVRVKGQTNWVTSNTAKPEDVLEYEIAYKNIGNSTENAVVIRDNLPPKMQYVPGSTKLKNDSGVKNVADGVTTTGISVGNYGPGAAAYVLFEVKVPAESALACGKTEFRNVGIAHPSGMNEYYNTAITTVEKKCQTPAPVYSCDMLQVQKLDNRQVKASVNYTAQSGATFKNVTIDWGDGSNIVTDKTKDVAHTYAKDGEYAVKATVRFSVNGTDKVVSSENCAAKVNFNTPVTPPTTPPTPTVLPSTGPEGVAGIVAATSAFGAVAHRVITRRANRD